MYIVKNKSPYKNKKNRKIYSSVLLRESYRENGKVKNRTVGNLSHCTPAEIAAVEFALKHKNDLSVLGSIKDSAKLQEELSVGAVWTVYQIAKSLGIDKALGNDFTGKLALWQVIARVIDQGSRLSCVRLAQTHAACDILDIRRGFDENDLYDNLSYMADNQEKIENKLFSLRKNQTAPNLFLYDVTSSYLEGEDNYFGEYGYNRDGKRGKKQIVIGLLCDDAGEPVSCEVFKGNTQDTKTFASQIEKIKERFNCKRVIMVGDRGMIKIPQMELMPENFHYITAITKPQIEKLIKRGVIQLGLFEDKLCEIEEEKIRYILRRNPIRAEEIKLTRISKQKKLEKAVSEKNEYLNEHKKAKVETAVKKIKNKIIGLKVGKWIQIKTEERKISLEIDEEGLKEESVLDGCYVITTDVPVETADKEIIHNRYKDLALVEKAFRDSKTVTLEIRPVYVRSCGSTRGHVLVVMLAYMIIRKLREAWAKFDLTVEEGLTQLSMLCSVKMIIKDQVSCLKIPTPRKSSQELLKALNIVMPEVLLHREVKVVTRKKLMGQRK